MKKVLFLLDYYLPDASPNGVCVSNIARQMVSSGWEVSILCFGNNSLDNADIVDGVRIYRCCDPGVKEKHTVGYAIKFYIKWFSPSKYPITERKNITRQFFDKANKLCSKNRFDEIVAVHLPVETLIAGVKLKELYPEIKLISYMLDSMSGGFIPRFLPESYLRGRKLKWENYIFNKYDSIILMASSKKHHDKHSSDQVWYQRSVFLDIPLLTTVNISEAVKQNNDKTTIAFCGLLNYPYRNVKYFLSIIKHMNEHYRFVFAGSSNIENELSCIDDDRIEYLGKIPHHEVERLLSRADILLNLGVTVPSAISGKIFEYMSYGKPIISTFSIDNEACIPYLQTYPLSFLVEERNTNIEEQAKHLQCFIEKTKNQRVAYEEVLKEFYNNTPDAFINELNQIV